MDTKETPALNSALVKAIAETQNVVEDAQNPFHKNSYATLGAHLHAIKPIFAKHGLAIVQFPVGGSNQVGINTIIVHKDGEEMQYVCTIPVSEGLKAQEAGSIFSYLRRYALASVAGIATDDDDAESTRVSSPAPVVKYIPNVVATPVPQAKPVAKKPVSLASSPELEEALSFVVPFGKNKGLTLGELQQNSLDWYIKEYQPKPYNGKISDKDVALRNALDLIRDSRSKPEPEQQEEPEDNVPF